MHRKVAPHLSDLGYEYGAYELLREQLVIDHKEVEELDEALRVVEAELPHGWLLTIAPETNLQIREITRSLKPAKQSADQTLSLVKRGFAGQWQVPADFDSYKVWSTALDGLNELHVTLKELLALLAFVVRRAIVITEKQGREPARSQPHPPAEIERSQYDALFKTGNLVFTLEEGLWIQL